MLLALSLLGGCSFLSDFDRFHVADDAGTDAGSSDGGSDGGGSDGGSSDGGSDGGADAAIDGGSDAGTGCAAAPSGIDTETTAAFTTLTNLRSAAGTTCATMVSELNTAGSMHSVYYEANKSNASCVPDPHTEVSGCALFYGADVMARATAAGYVGTAVSQVMVFGFGSPANPASAIPMALDSLGRRLPLLSPWIRDFGYGHGTETGTLPFGVGASAPATWTATYPYANQTGVPRSYSGTGDVGPRAEHWVPQRLPDHDLPAGYGDQPYADRLRIRDVARASMVALKRPGGRLRPAPERLRAPSRRASRRDHDVSRASGGHERERRRVVRLHVHDEELRHPYERGVRQDAVMGDPRTKSPAELPAPLARHVAVLLHDVHE